ncbi:MAG: ABC transporter transmembrane domain-containing protein [Turicibacter sp.]|nr:ABC transporter transmembrane domain-containing protein [Turicibacter sp.]
MTPEYIKQAFDQQGIKNLIYAIHTDMNANGDFADVYTAVDNDYLYILTGEELVTRTVGPRRIVSEYRVDNLEKIPLTELGWLRTEKMLSTGRLIASDDEKQPEKERLLILYTLGYLGFVERLIKVVKNINAKEDPLKEVVVDDDLFCHKCGLRYPEPERKLCPKCMDKTGITLRLLGFFKFYKGKVAAIMLLMLLSTGLAIFSPIIGTQLFLDDVLTAGGQFYGMVAYIVGLLVFVRFVNTIFNTIHGYVLAQIMPWIIYDLKLRIFEAMQRLSISFYTSKRTGNLMNRVNRDANNIYWFFVDGVPFLFVNVLMFIGVIILMFVLNAQLALIAVAVIPICVLLFKLLFRIFRGFHHKDWVYSSQMNSMVSDSVNGRRVIKAFAREAEEVGRFSVAGGKQAGIETKMFNMGFTAFPLIYILMFGGQVVVTAIGGIMVINGEMTLGVLMTFIAYLSMLYGPLEFLSWVSNWWARCLDSAQRVFEIIDTKPDVTEPENPTVLAEIAGDIDIKDVWFEYDPATPILKGLSLSVAAGKTLGIVGKTGAGKSTLANLVARLYDVKEGVITVDGVNVKQLPLAQLRQNIGVVSQDIYLFIGSIADNIRYARPSATIEEVIWAAKVASAHEFIMNLPDGYETRVGAGGQDLSGGEKQRLSIARTITQNPKILILDEATAAMDTETEGKIQTALNLLQKDRTTIAIAHRLSTLKDADALAVIEDGKVVESGTHEELMKLKKEYHKLFMIQMEGLKVISMD